jgi:hypothetical protein
MGKAEASQGGKIMSDTSKLDYGEPWKIVTAGTAGQYEFIRTRDGGTPERARGVVCANACAGMQDPAKEIPALRDQIKNSAINTNVRLFDLVRYMRSELHEAQLINDDEYAWLCGGSEMAHSPKGGSPSPRRLEDYDAMREAIREAHTVLRDILKNYECGDAIDSQCEAALAKLQPFTTP